MFSLRADRIAMCAATACLVFTLGAAPAPAQTAGKQAQPAAKSSGAVEGIAAVVNDEVVSASDVHARLRLLMLNAGMPDNAETRQRLMPQVLRQLVDERLQLQEAKRLNVTTTPAEVDEAVNRIAQQNRMSRQQLQKLLGDRSVPMSTLSEQIRSALAWQRVVQRRARQEVSIGEEEINAALERTKANIGKPEYLVAEIFLAVDSPDQDEQVRRVADRLLEEIRKGGNFASVARQFSQSAGAAQGGDIGWVRPGDLADELERSLQTLRPGQLSPPIRSASGYHILAVRDRRAFGSGTSEVQEARANAPAQPVVQRQPVKPDISKARVHMKQIVIPAASPEQRKNVIAFAEKLRKQIKGCSDFEQKAKESGVEQSGDLGMVRVKDLAPGLQQLAALIPVGETSPVLSGPSGSLLLIVCKREGVVMPEPVAAPAPAAPPPPPVSNKPVAMPTREDIERDLMSDRAELLARRYLRDLRRAAFVEYRI